MKNRSFFSQIMLLVVLSVVCIVLTVGIAFLVGSYNTTLFDFTNLNLANMIPVLILGGFISCVIVGITILFISRSVFLKIKNYLSNDNGGDKE